MSDVFFQSVTLFAGLLLGRAVVGSAAPSLTDLDRLRVGLDRRGRHTSVVTGKSLAITNCEMKTTGFLKSFVGLFSSLGNGTSASLAQRVAA